MKFGVPLRGGNIALVETIASTNRLGHVVWHAPGFHLKIGRHALDALVVNAVDPRAQIAGLERG
jgi:hypothetical protein